MMQTLRLGIDAMGRKILCVGFTEKHRELLLALQAMGFQAEELNNTQEQLRLFYTSKFDALLFTGKGSATRLERLVNMLKQKRIQSRMFMVDDDYSLSNMEYCFDLGFDEYCALIPEEVGVRLTAMLAKRESKRNSWLKLGNVEVDLNSRFLKRDGELISLAPKEADLLSILIESGHEAVGANVLIRQLEKSHRDVVKARNSLNVHIRRIRAKGGNNLIQTIRGTGYSIGVDLE